MIYSLFLVRIHQSSDFIYIFFQSTPYPRPMGWIHLRISTTTCPDSSSTTFWGRRTGFLRTPSIFSGKERPLWVELLRKTLGLSILALQCALKCLKCMKLLSCLLPASTITNVHKERSRFKTHPHLHDKRSLPQKCHEFWNSGNLHLQ